MFGIKAKIHNIENRIINTLFLIRNPEISKPCILQKPRYIRTGRNVRIKKYSRIECYDSFGGGVLSPSLVIGDNVIIGYRFSCLVADDIIIGRNTILASDILITSENHGMDPECGIPYHEQELITGLITIGSNCWIGEKVIILPSVSVGDYCVIAAGSIVNKSIPPYSIAAGNPARVVKKYDFYKHQWVHC